MTRYAEAGRRFDSTEFLKGLLGYIERIKQYGPCDKCGRPVPPNNNVAVFEYLNTGGHWSNELNLNRHVEPVVDGSGVVICEGSPSRWQDISGMPDLRVEYRSGKGPNAVAQDMWQFMQTLHERQRIVSPTAGTV